LKSTKKPPAKNVVFENPPSPKDIKELTQPGVRTSDRWNQSEVSIKTLAINTNPSEVTPRESVVLSPVNKPKKVLAPRVSIKE